MMKAGIVGIVMMVMAAIVPEVYGATHTVGGSSGWNQGVDYTSWASGETFAVGDTLVFTYGTSHSVDQVSQSDYTNCNNGNALKSYTGGSTTITLTTAGPVYYICPTAGHCQGGMKLSITVGASSTTPGSPSTTPTAPGSSPSTPTTTTSPPPPPKSGSVGAGGNLNAVLIGVSFLVATVVGLMC